MKIVPIKVHLYTFAKYSACQYILLLILSYCYCLYEKLSRNIGHAKQIAHLLTHLEYSYILTTWKYVM